MVKRAFLVLGPESSGTRMITQALIEAGCYGDATAEQRLDDGLSGAEPPIVWRRSVPHRQAYPDIGFMIAQLRGEGYEVQAVVTTRDWYPMLRSQVARGHTPTAAKARQRTRKAYLHIFRALGDVGAPFTVVSYEAVVRKQEALKAVMSELGLGAPEMDIYDANAKWYEEVAA